MDVRHLLALVVALPLVAALPADAASKKPKPKPAGCAFTDPRGDAGLFSDSSLDITGGSVTVTAKEVVAVLRLAGPDRTPPAGYEWRLGFMANGVRHEFSYRAALTGPASSSATAGGQQLAHRFTADGTTLVWRVQRSIALNKPKTVLSVWAATSVATVSTDTATSRPCVY